MIFTVFNNTAFFFKHVTLKNNKWNILTCVMHITTNTTLYVDGKGDTLAITSLQHGERLMLSGQ